MYKVKIIHGSMPKVPHGYGSWLHYFEEKSVRPVMGCHRSLCYIDYNIDFVIVKRLDENNDSLYLIPLCKNHHSSSDEFYVKDSLVKLP